MPWQLWLMIAGIVAIFYSIALGVAGKGRVAVALLVTGFGLPLAGVAMMPDPPLDRASAARATIAAATAAVDANATEAALAALEAQAAKAATAAGDGK